MFFTIYYFAMCEILQELVHDAIRGLALMSLFIQEVPVQRLKVLQHIVGVQQRFPCASLIRVHRCIIYQFIFIRTRNI